MLWTDQDFITPDELIALDAEVGAVSSAESITLTGPTGIIHKAIEEAGDNVMKFAQQFGGAIYNGAVSSNHYAAVMNTGLPAVNRTKFLMSQVVISSLYQSTTSEIKRWVLYWALMVFFRDAANIAVNTTDRYQKKMERYEKQLHTRYWQAVLAKGIPVAIQPLPAPGVQYDIFMGTWADSNASTVSGSGTLVGQAQVAVTWFNGIAVVNNESAMSQPANVTLASGQVLQVSIGTLQPPSGQQDPSTMPLSCVAYGTATAWNLYVSFNGGPFILQNSSPIPIATTVYTLTGDVQTSGTQAGTGQYPDEYLHVTTGMLERG